MSRLTSRQRKIVYLAGILVLSVPIIWLGMPAAGGTDSGGYLSRLRSDYDLGETSLGQVDPTSSAMNLVLLGLRGVATNLLWMDALEEQKTKDWGKLRSTVESIIMLQPHYRKVWEFQGWNLAFNVSAQWDAVADRYYWVKQGAKFLERGTNRNRTAPDLYWWTGHVLGHKIGRADEWRYYRDFFLHDPNTEKFNGGPDPEVNPDGKDNYLVAKDWYERANRVEESHEQHIMMRMLFRQYPARSQLAYAQALQREGLFDEKTQIAWDRGYQEWTGEFGREKFQAPVTEDRIGIWLEMSEQEAEDLAEQTGADAESIRHWVNRYQNTANYRYWRTRALAESEPETVAAHRDIYEGQQLFKEGRLSRAQEKLFSGLTKFEQMLDRHPSLAKQDNTVEEGLMGLIYWRYIHLLEDEPLPSDFPLKALWLQHQQLVPELRDRFRRENGL